MTISSSDAPMCPLPGVSVPLRTYPDRWNYVLMGINIVLFVMTLSLGYIAYAYWALLPSRVLYAGEWWRIITSAFVHSGWLHIASNMYALYFLGAGCEHFFGPRRFLGIYFASIMGSGISVTVFSSPNTITVGASGAILGLLGAMMVYFWKVTIDSPERSRTLTPTHSLAAVNQPPQQSS